VEEVNSYVEISLLRSDSAYPGSMTGWQSVVKTIFDYLTAAIILMILSPFLLLLAIIIRISGKGPVLYTQDRIGKDGKPFVIYKFRSMVYEPDKSPALSGFNGGTITRLGCFMRKYRIDEIPNFINVLRGEMSVIGPRPERKYYIDLIVKKIPEYTMIHRIKTGITGWAQVKYRYAANVEEMIKRFEFERYYLQHRSLILDLKIIFLTFGTVLRGKGF